MIPVHKSSSVIVPYICLVSANLLWASSFIVLKIAFQYYHPMVVIFFRMLVGSLCFFCMPSLFRNISIAKKDIKLIAMMVLFEPCLYFTLEARAIELSTVSQVGLISAMLPLMVSIVAVFVLNEKLSQKSFLGMAVSIFGACWLSFSGESSPSAPNPPMGNFFEFLAMMCASGYIIILKQMTLKGYSPFFLTALQAFAGSLFFLPALFFPSTTLPTGFETVPVLCIIYLGAGVTLGGYCFYNFGISRVSAAHAASFINLIPVFTLIMAMVILHERLTAQQTMASVLVFTGIYISQQRQKRPVQSIVRK